LAKLRHITRKNGVQACANFPSGCSVSAILKLEIAVSCCNGSNVADRFKSFVAILMAVLALGIWTPQTACAAGASEAGKSCCCTENPICKCQPDMPCKQSCTLAQVKTFDKQLPARTTLAPSARALLFLITPTKIKFLVTVPVAYRRDWNVSPPFGGNPPQAVLRLWLI
jgi:hypothetical protein